MRIRKFLAFILILLLALALRVYLLMTSMNPIEADQATAGLMALHILRGEFPFFYYGLHYQGPLDAYLTAPLMAVFGSNRLIIRIVPVFFSLIFVFVTYLLGKCLYSEIIGLYGAVYAALSPFMLTFRGLVADADYIMVLVVGNVSLLLFHSYQLSPSRKKQFSLICLLILGFWLHPVMGYYLIAMGVVWMAGKIRPVKNIRSIQMSKAVVGFFGTYSTLINGKLGWYVGAISTLTLPVILGFIVPPPYHQIEIYTHYPLDGSLGGVFVVILTILIVLLITWSGVRLIQQGQGLLPIYAFVTLFLFSAFSIIIGVKFDLLTLPRYLMPIYSAIPLGVWALFYVTHKRVWLRPVIMAALVAVNLYSDLTIKAISMPYDLLDWLKNRDGNQYVYTDYWTGYWLAFESSEKIIPAVIDDQNQEGFNRYRPYVQRVEESVNPLYIYIAENPSEIDFKDYLSRNGITYQMTSIDGYTIFSDLSRRITYPLINR